MYNLSNDTDIFSQTELGEKIGEMKEQKTNPIDFRQQFIMDIENYKNIQHQQQLDIAKKRLEFAKLKYKYAKIDEEIRFVYLKIEEVKYIKLLRQCNTKLSKTKDFSMHKLIRKHSINLLYNIDDFDSDRRDLIISFIERLENVDILKIVSRIIVKTYCCKGDINPAIIKKQIRKDEFMDNLVFARY